MKRLIPRLALAVLIAVSLAMMSGAARAKDPILHPDKLIIVSTSDVKGKTGPCG